MENEKPSATEKAVIGAGVGAAGVTGSVGIIGVATAVAALPISLVVGVIGGLIWWAVSDD